MTELRVPDLGESIVEATIGTWLKNVGDSVASGEAVVELETDKVNVEVMADAAGILQQIHHQTGDTVTPGDVIGEVGEGKVESAGQSAPAGGNDDADNPSNNPTPVEGVETGNQVKGDAPSQNTEANAASSSIRPRSTPAMRRMASERGVTVEELTGTPESEQAPPSVEANNHPANSAAQPQRTAASKGADSSSAHASTSPAASSKADELEAAGLEEHVRLSRRRLTIAKRLVEAQHTAAMLTTFNEIDMTAVMNVRKRHKEGFKERYGVGLGFMSFFTKAVIGALKTIPRLNAEIRGEEMILKHYYDIGIAVSTEGGLVVPVVRDADALSFAEIEQKIALLAKRARDNQLSLDDLSGGSFTITNGGTFGSLLSTPILNPPQVGILGMHKIEERPVGVGGQIELRPMMYVALSYDHRIVDGSEAVRFLVRVKQLLEDPEQLWLEG